MNSVYNTPKIKQNDNHQISLNIAHLLVDLNHAQPAGVLQHVFVVGQVVLFEDAAVKRSRIYLKPAEEAIWPIFE